jgi:hypothetical protein
MTTAKQTQTDGSAAARFAAAQLGIATCAETTATTMAEDCAKVDIKFSFKHAISSERLITYHAQIKAGPSYKQPSSNSRHLVLDIDKATISALSGTGLPGLLIWVPPPPMDRLYWHTADPRNQIKTPICIQRNQYIRPSLRYDLSRIYDYASFAPGYPQLTIRPVKPTDITKDAKKAYKELRSLKPHNSLIGDIGVTRQGWRHVTRRSKTTARRELSLRVVPYLKYFLFRRPERYVCNYCDIQVDGRWATESRYLLCWYRKALSIEGDSYTLLIRIKEEIRYPAGWKDSPLSKNKVHQTTTLASWWCKRE